MFRLIYLISFLIKNYWRKTHFVIQFFILAVVSGYLFDPRYAPYSYQYIVLVKNITMIIISYLTVYQLNKKSYNRSIYVLLNRVKRSWYYLGSVFSSAIIVLFLSLLLDIYILIFTGLSFFDLFNLSLIFYSISNILLTILIANLFSLYTIMGKYQVIGFLLIGFGSIPDWYVSLPLEKTFYYLSYLLPSLGKNILLQQEKIFLSWTMFWSLIYMIFILIIGIRRFNRRNLVDLK